MSVHDEQENDERSYHSQQLNHIQTPSGGNVIGNEDAEERLMRSDGGLMNRTPNKPYGMANRAKGRHDKSAKILEMGV